MGLVGGFLGLLGGFDGLTSGLAGLASGFVGSTRLVSAAPASAGSPEGSAIIASAGTSVEISVDGTAADDVTTAEVAPSGARRFGGGVLGWGFPLDGTETLACCGLLGFPGGGGGFARPGLLGFGPAGGPRFPGGGAGLLFRGGAGLLPGVGLEGAFDGFAGGVACLPPSGTAGCASAGGPGFAVGLDGLECDPRRALGLADGRGGRSAVLDGSIVCARPRGPAAIDGGRDGLDGGLSPLTVVRRTNSEAVGADAGLGGCSVAFSSTRTVSAAPGKFASVPCGSSSFVAAAKGSGGNGPSS